MKQEQCSVIMQDGITRVVFSGKEHHIKAEEYAKKLSKIDQSCGFSHVYLVTDMIEYRGEEGVDDGVVRGVIVESKPARVITGEITDPDDCCERPPIDSDDK